MASISDYLKNILAARYGKDVRQSIHDAIQQCYYDGKAGSIDLEARQSIEDLDNNKLDKTGDSASNTVTFTSGDSTSPTGWADIVAVASGETHASLFRKFSLAVKNLRYLYKMLGSTDISAIGDGTITGAISTQNSNFLGKNISSDFTVTNISDFVAYKVGNMVVFSFTCIDSTKDCKITTVKHKPILNSGYFATCYQAWANKDYQCVLSGACLTDGTIVDFKGTYNLPYPFISGRNIIYFT